MTTARQADSTPPGVADDGRLPDPGAAGVRAAGGRGPPEEAAPRPRRLAPAAGPDQAEPSRRRTTPTVLSRITRSMTGVQFST